MSSSAAAEKQQWSHRPGSLFCWLESQFPHQSEGWASREKNVVGFMLLAGKRVLVVVNLPLDVQRVDGGEVVVHDKDQLHG